VNFSAISFLSRLMAAAIAVGILGWLSCRYTRVHGSGDV